MDALIIIITAALSFAAGIGAYITFINSENLDSDESPDMENKLEKMNTELKQFTDTIDMALNLTQKKRFYISDYGYGNVREVINGEQDKLVRGQNWDKFHLENILAWWKKKATKRYDKLKAEGRFRDKVELWTQDDDIQIIR